MYDIAVDGVDEAFKVLDVLEDLDVGCVPDVLSAAHILGEFFDDVPVVVALELIGVSPDVEELRAVLGSTYVNRMDIPRLSEICLRFT